MEQLSRKEPAPAPRRKRSLLSPLIEPLRNIRKESSEIRSDEKNGVKEPDATKKLIERKWAVSLAVSEIAGTFIGAPLIGSLAQYTSGNANMGIIGTIIGDYFPAVAAFSIMWHSLSRDFYKKSGGFFKQLKELAKDILPFMGVGLIAALPAYAASALLSGLYVAGAEFISRKFAHAFPVPVISEALNYFVAEAIFIYGAIKLRHWPIRKFQERYEALQESAESEPN